MHTIQLVYRGIADLCEKMHAIPLLATTVPGCWASCESSLNQKRRQFSGPHVVLSVQNPEHVKAKMELERTAKKIQSQENELKALQEKEKERESKCQLLRKQLQDLRAGERSQLRFDQIHYHVQNTRTLVLRKGFGYLCTEEL